MFDSDVLVRKTELRERLSFWLRKAAAGKRLLIADRGRPIAVIIPWKKDTLVTEEEFAKLAREIDRRAIPWNSLGVIRKERRKRTATLSMK